MSLLDPSLQLPLAQNIIPRLPIEALVSCACTCRSLRNVLRSDWLSAQWWHDLAELKLGSQHPVFQQQGARPGRDQLRSAVIQYYSAVKCMQAAKFKQGKHCSMGQIWLPEASLLILGPC